MFPYGGNVTNPLLRWRTTVIIEHGAKRPTVKNIFKNTRTNTHLRWLILDVKMIVITLLSLSTPLTTKDVSLILAQMALVARVFLLHDFLIYITHSHTSPNNLLSLLFWPTAHHRFSSRLTIPILETISSSICFSTLRPNHLNFLLLSIFPGFTYFYTIQSRHTSTLTIRFSRLSFLFLFLV